MSLIERPIRNRTEVQGRIAPLYQGLSAVIRDQTRILGSEKVFFLDNRPVEGPSGFFAFYDRYSGGNLQMLNKIQQLYEENGTPDSRVITVSISEVKQDRVAALASANGVPYSSTGALQTSYYLLESNVVKVVTSYKEGGNDSPQNELANRQCEMNEGDYFRLEKVLHGLQSDTL
jgi:hypothetical protein